jgi:hypothetical protein
MQSTHQAALQSRTDLTKYGDNALLLFTLQLRFEIEDIDAVATNSLTDGSNDKKCDLVYVDKESHIAVIAQGYFCSKTTLPSEAPANKASDLNTAVVWLLSTPINDLPTQLLQSAASELREALQNNELNSIEFWYSHNLPESKNVRNELDAVTRNAQNTVRQNFPECTNINIAGIELGITATEDIYKSLTTPILVSDELSVLTSEGGFNISAADWRAFITTIPADWLYDLFKKYESKLFSANIRGYLGSRNVDANINNGIKQTAQDDSDHFCVFNNGITAITHEFQYDSLSKLLKLTGISIVNGAQTTGAIGHLASSPSANVRIQARFIVCSNQSTIKSVIRYNNSQNKVQAPDFRSNDSVQSRLVIEFNNIPDAEYFGGRRGGSEGVIKRRANLLPSSTVGQALTAFHGDPLNAYNRKSDIWESNSLYERVFNTKTTAKHIVFVYSLHEALDDFKRELSKKKESNSLDKAELSQLTFFLYRGSNLVAVTAISECLEVLLKTQIPDLFKLSFGNVSPNDANLIWKEVLTPLIALISQLVPAVKDGIKGQASTSPTIDIFRSLVDATKVPNSSIYESFRNKVKIN